MTVPREGVDYAWGDPGVAAIKRAGKTFVCRYLSHDSSKNLRADEAKALRKAGIDIVTVWETYEGRALAGTQAGINDATEALRQLSVLGAPAGAPVYFAVDFDANSIDLLSVGLYLRGAAKVLGLERVGVYGGIRTVRHSLDNGLATYAWQTYAWSGGAWDGRAQLRQYSNGHRINGVAVDYCMAVADDFGQWKRPAKRRKGLPGPAQKPAWFWAALKQFLANRAASKAGV